MGEREHGGLQSQNLLYEAATHHWVHAEQIRWTLLSNFLVAASILLLSWAALFASDADARFVLTLLCLVGMFLSLVWLVLGERANGFVAVYNELGRQAERSLRDDNPGPFESAHEYRTSTNWRLMRSLRTENVIIGVPIVFLVLFVFLLFVSIGLASG